MNGTLHCHDRWCCVLARSQVDTIGWLGLQHVHLNVVRGESSDGKLTDREPLPISFAGSGGMVVGRTRPSALPLRDTFRARRQSKNNGGVPPMSTGPFNLPILFILMRWTTSPCKLLSAAIDLPDRLENCSTRKKKRGGKEGRSTSSCAQIK